MAQASILQFAHRLNDGGTIDSICRDCFVTVVAAFSGSALTHGECGHTCDVGLVER